MLSFTLSNPIFKYQKEKGWCKLKISITSAITSFLICFNGKRE